MRRINNSSERVTQRRQSAIERQLERDKRSPQQQLDHLDEMLGKNQGAKKERARLERMLSKQ